MDILLGLLAALAYGSSDFAAGVSGRRIGAGLVVSIVQAIAFGVAVIATWVFPGSGPAFAALSWGVAAGIGSVIGTYALYRGLAIGQMSVVAPLSAIIAAVVPAVGGLALGERLSTLAVAGLTIAVPAIGLVSWQRGCGDNAGRKTGAFEGLLSGIGFAVLFLALNRAGTHSGAWPLVSGLAVATLIVLPLGWRQSALLVKAARSTLWVIAAAGLLGGIANLLFLLAAAQGQLAIVAVLTALYPAVTILLARFILRERWNAAQAAGLVAAAVAVVFVTLG